MAETARKQTDPGPLFKVDEAAVRLNVEVRMVRRLIAERRIRFVHVGRHVRISESAILDFIAAGTVEVRPARVRRWVA